MGASLLQKMMWTAWLACQARAWRRLPYRSPEYIQAVQDRLVRRIIHHAYATVPFYRRTMDELGLRPSGIVTAADLGKLPTVAKRDVQEHPEWFASNRCRLEGLPSERTSGTTGEALTVWYAPSFLMRVALLNRRDGEVWKEVVTGACHHMVLAVPHALAEAASAYYRERLWIPPVLRHELAAVSMGLPLSEQIDRINAYRPAVLVANVSALEKLWCYQQKLGAEMRMPSVILTTGEMLPEDLRERVQASWGSRVFGRYGAAEAVKLGFECRVQQGYHLHSDWVAVRIVDREGQDVQPGEAGEVVISVLRNRAFVLLNYRLGDRAILNTRQCACGRSLTRLTLLEGKASERLELGNGRVVYTLELVQAIKFGEDLRRFQIVHTGAARITVLVVPAEDAVAEFVQATVQANVRELVGDVAAVEAVVVPEIPVTSGGKTPLFISRAE